jgi:hypothetical protein
MRRREASINDVPIGESERRIFGPRPESKRGVPFHFASWLARDGPGYGPYVRQP